MKVWTVKLQKKENALTKEPNAELLKAPMLLIPLSKANAYVERSAACKWY